MVDACTFFVRNCSSRYSNILEVFMCILAFPESKDSKFVDVPSPKALSTKSNSNHSIRPSAIHSMSAITQLPPSVCFVLFRYLGFKRKFDCDRI